MFHFRFLKVITAILCCCCITQSWAQVSYVITPQNLKMCDVQKTFTVQITNSGGVVGQQDLEVVLSYGSQENTGLYISNPSSASAKVSYPAFVANSPTLPIRISSLNAGESVSVSFNALAGCKVNIDQAASIVANAFVKVGGVPNASSQVNFSINASGNGNLLVEFPSAEMFGQKGGTVTRTYKLKKGGIKDFSGYVRFNEQFMTGSVLQIQNIKVTFPNNIVWNFNQNDFTLSDVSLIDNQELLIEETLLVSNCISPTDAGRSTISITSGCNSFESCDLTSAGMRVKPDPKTPSITPIFPSAVLDSYFMCMNGDYVEKSCSFSNAANAAIANNVSILYIPANGYITDPSSFRIEIKNSSGVTIKSGDFVQDPSTLPGVGATGYMINGNTIHNETYFYYYDIVAPYDEYQGNPRYTSLFPCASTDYVYSRIIKKYKNSITLQDEFINLNPGETIIVYWKDKPCCFNQNQMASGSLSKPIFRVYAETCSLVVQPQFLAGGVPASNNEVRQLMEPYSVMMDGNPDRCISSFDGEIQNFQFEFTAFSLGFMINNNASTWGNLVVELDLKDGADLDLSLNGTAAVESYNHIGCSPVLWSASDPERYRISFRHGDRIFNGSVVLMPSDGVWNKRYRISFSLKDFFDAYKASGELHEITKLFQFIRESQLWYSLRSYCGNPRTDISMKLYYQASSDVCSNNTCMMLLNSQDYHIMVTCPGCVTPGGNITSAVFERHEDYVGYVDADNDHSPDGPTLVTGIARTNCTNGDVMISRLSVELTDGDITRNGFGVDNLPSANHLDNLYIIYEYDKSVIEYSASTPVQVSFSPTGPWSSVTATPISTGTGIVFQVKASDLSIADFHTNRIVHFRTNFQIKREYISPERTVKQFYVVYTPWFSDSDTWSGIVNEEASNVSCNWNGTSGIQQACPDWKPNMIYFCQGGESLITVFPTETTYRLEGNSADLCAPVIRLKSGISTLGAHFPQEYRRWRFYDSSPNQEFIFEAQIPNGYKVTALDINSDNDRYTVAAGSIPMKGMGYNSLGIQIDNTNRLFVKLKFRYQDFAQPWNTIVLPYAGQAIRINDDYLYARVEATIASESCSGFTYDAFQYTGDVNGNTLSYPNVKFIDHPVINVPTLPNALTGIFPITTGGTELLIAKPATKLTGTSSSVVSPSGNKYYVPLSFDNTKPVDANGNPIAVGTGILSSFNAKFPFVYISNLSDLISKGFSVVGVYEGAHNSSTSTSGLENFYGTANNGIATLKKSNGTPNNAFISANTTFNGYTLILQYNCPVGCEPIVAACSTAIANYPDCIKSVKELQLKYGWGCEGYPATPGEAMASCNLKEIAPVQLITPAVALDYSTTLGTTQLCQEFDYTIKVKSCKEGVISNLIAKIQLPDGLSYVSNDKGLTATTSGMNEISFGNILSTLAPNPGSFANGDEITINVKLKINSINASLTNTISLKLEAITYCGTNFSRIQDDEVQLTPPLTGLNSEYCVNSSPIIITPVTAGGIFTGPVTINSNGSATFTPSIAGVGTHTITYSEAGQTSCAVSYNVIVKALPTVTIVTQDGLGSVLIPTCHEQVVLTETNGYSSYQWYKDGSILAGQTNSSLTINYQAGMSKAGWYSVSVTENGCTNSGGVNVIDEIEITGKNEICPGDNANLNVKVYGVTGNYLVQWFKNNAQTSTPDGLAGSYYALVVLPGIIPACTLATQPFNVALLPAPAAYTVTSDKTNICPGEFVHLTGTAPTSSNPVITSYSWNNGSKALSFDVTDGGSYYITAVGANGCTSTSNRVTVVVPHISITQKCVDAQRTQLSAQLNIPGNNFVWKDASNNVIATTPVIEVTADGTYSVTTTDILCNITTTTSVCRNTDNTNIDINYIAHGDFDMTSITLPACSLDVDNNSIINESVLGFASDLTCTDVSLSTNNWPGHVKISNNAAVENGSDWTGTGFVKIGSDNHFLIADGAVIAEPQKVWYTTVTVENCATYNFSALVSNIDVNTIQPSQIPNVELKIDGVSITRQTLFQNQAMWTQLGGRWKSNKNGQIEIAIVLAGGGWVGRDIGIDEVYFAKVNCSSNTGVIPCNASAEVGEKSLYICAGASIQIGNNTSEAGLTYLWNSEDNTFTSTNVKPTVAPTQTTSYILTVTDAANKCSSTDKVTVYIINPSVTISSETGICGLTFKTNLFSGIPNPQYKWYVNGIHTMTNTTGVFTPTNINVGDKVKCQLQSSCGLSSFSNEITVTGGAISADAGADKEVCSGSSVQIGSTSIVGHTYLWSPVTGLNNSAIANPVAGPAVTTTYTVTETDNNGCIKTDIVIVTVNSAVTLAITRMPAGEACRFQSTDLTALPSNGTPPYSYAWKRGSSLIESTSQLTVPTTDNLNVTVTDSKGCFATQTIIVTQSSSEPILTGTITSSICSGAAISVPFTVTSCAQGQLTAGNIFTAQLSNASGSFANPVTIGSLLGTNSGTISALIPANTVSGSGYRVRVVSSNYAFLGKQNTNNISIVSNCGSKMNTTYDGMVSSPDSNNFSQVYIYPNPFAHETAIIVKGEDSKKVNIRIFDLHGRTVITMGVWNNLPTNIGSDLMPGVYIVEVSSEDKRTMHKVIKAE